MNQYVESIKAVDLDKVKRILQKDPKWLEWSEPSGKNALHYLCSVRVSDQPSKADLSLAILKLLLKSGMDINSIHRIEAKNCDDFPATPLWYAYTRGRHARLYKYLLRNGADPGHCWWAIAWYDDIAAAELWLKHGAKIDERPNMNELFVGSFAWKKNAFVKWTLDHGADINAVGPDGNTALIVAVKRRDEDAISQLISFGADRDKENAKGLSARKIAEQKGPKRLLRLLDAL